MRVLLSLTAAFGGFVVTWFVLMSVLTGERYVSALEITPLAALAGLAAGVLAWLLMTPRRPEAEQPARPARKLTDAHVQLAVADPPAPPPPARPQPASIPEDTAAAWLALDGQRVAWPAADRPAGDAIACYIKGRRAIRYTAQDGSQHTMFVDQVRQ